jgi:transcription termination factor Rho
VTELDRATLESKERDQLQAIAAAMGMRALSRMRKADLVEAIVNGGRSTPSPGATEARNGRARTQPDAAPSEGSAADGGAPEGGAAQRGDAAPPAPSDAGAGSPAPQQLPIDAPEADRNTVRSTARGNGSSIDALAAEEAALAGPSAPDLSDLQPRPVRRAWSGPSGPMVKTFDDPRDTPRPAAEQPAAAAGAAVEERAAPSSTGAPHGGPAPAAQAPAAAASPAGPSGGSAPSASTSEQTDQGGAAGGEGGDEADRSWRDDGDGSGRKRRRRRGRDRDRDDVRPEVRPEVRDARPGDEPRRDDRRDAESSEVIEVQGILEIRDEGYGFLRTQGILPSKRDVYVSASQVRRFGLRKGDHVNGATRPPSSNEKYPALLRVDLVNELTPDDARQRREFSDLTPLFPDERLRLETIGERDNLTGRIIDLISPIGKGQRGLIVSPPKAGKTTIMKQIVRSIETNNPEVHLIVLLVDERPEEVTDMRRHVLRGEVAASTFDRPAEEHTQVAELTIERAKRLVEMGKDVVVVLDGITRLARAYNLAAPATGRIMSGGVDSGALYPPKKFFGAARNVEEGGSLTILATALVETGSKMDEVIFEEFKGTGNMELRLDRRLAERRIYPSIDVAGSSTRHEELLFDRRQLQQVWKLRRVLTALDGGGGLELLMDKIKTTRSNDEFLDEIAKAPSGGM